MPEPVGVSIKEPSQGYQLGVVREVLLALLATEASHGYQLRARLQLALGPLAQMLSAGQVYVTLNRLEKAGLVTAERVGQTDRPDRKVYDLTAAGRERIAEWLADTSWPKPAPAEFHLKLVAAAAAGLGDPVRLVDTQRHAVLAGLAADAARRAGRAGRLGRRAVARRRRAEAAGGPALARGVRPVLDLGEGITMTAGESLSHIGPVLRARGLEMEYGRGAGVVRALDAVDLEVAAGETLAVMGPSGCGKSTLLHLLGGLERPSAGEVWLEERRTDKLSEKALARLRRGAIGFVFQAFHLMDELTAVENVELPALLAGRSPRAARRRAAELLDQVGLSERTEHLPSALSGGERQRVAVARALSNEPLVVLADEPTGNLDSAATLDVLRLLDSLRAAGQTLVIVTHDARIAATADRLISMRDGAFVEETRLTRGTGQLGELAGLEG